MKRLSEIMMKNGVRDFVFDTLIRYRIPDWEVTEYTVFPEVKEWITSQTKKPEHDRSKSRITEDFLYFRKYPDSRCADYINILNINSMETTKTTEKFQSVHKTFSYTPKSALTNQWSSLAFGIGMVIVPLIYPFGLRIRRAVILSPEVLSTILIIVGRCCF